MAIKSITRISTAADGTQGNYSSVSPVFSPDGGKVAFSSDASNIVPGDTNGFADVFVKGPWQWGDSAHLDRCRRYAGQL